MPESDPSVSELQTEIKALRARVRELEQIEGTHGRTVEALRESEERLRQTTESLPIVLFSAEAITNRIFLMRGAVEEIFGYDRDRFLSDPSFGPTLVHPDDAAMVAERCEKGLASLQPFMFVFRIIHGVTGESRWLQQQVVPIIGPDGSMIRQDVLILDITASKRAEEALRDSEKRLRAVAEGSPIILFAIEQDGTISLCEGKPLEHLNIRPQDLVGRSVREVFGNVPQAMADFARVLAGETATTALSVQGRSFEIWHSPVRDQQGEITGIIGVANDVTEHNRLQAQLLQSQKLQSIGTLAGGVAHDFGNLLAVIIGNLSIVLRKDPATPKAKELLRDVMGAAERASALTHQLLAFARGGLQKPAPTNLNCHVESVLQIIRRTTPRQIDLRVELDTDLPQVIADPTQMEQVIMNLCLNAVEASRQPSRIDVYTACEEVAADQAAALELPPGRYVRFGVRDRGCGMDAATVERVFEPFFTTKPTGRGMGLAATQGIVHSHKGQIRIDSTLGKGTTVSVWLPVAPWEASQQTSASKPSVSTLPRGNETVLLIDEQKTDLQTAEASLSSLGYCTVSRADLASALAFLETNSDDVHLVLLDVDISHFPRVSPLRQIRKHCPEVPVLLTGRSLTDAALRRLRKQGAMGLVRKPFELPELAAAVRSCLDMVPGRNRSS